MIESILVLLLSIIMLITVGMAVSSAYDDAKEHRKMKKRLNIYVKRISEELFVFIGTVTFFIFILAWLIVILLDIYND